jgi:glutamine---fructose-6-phosphate transaminase (isomerizing)
LIKYIYDKHKANGDKLTFQDLVELVIAQLEGAFSFLFKSVHFPGELAASRRGSPLLVGVKCESQLGTNHIPVIFSKGLFVFFYIFFELNVSFAHVVPTNNLNPIDPI